MANSIILICLAVALAPSYLPVTAFNLDPELQSILQQAIAGNVSFSSLLGEGADVPAGLEADPAIAGSIAEARKVLQDIDNFLGDPEVPIAFKDQLNSEIAELVETTEEFIETGRTTPLPTTTQPVDWDGFWAFLLNATNELVKEGDEVEIPVSRLAEEVNGPENLSMLELQKRSDPQTGGKTCCKTRMPKVVETSYRQISLSKQWYERSYYSTSCGFLGWDRCRRSRSHLRSSTEYRAQAAYSYGPPRPCPTNMYTCCAGQFWFANRICMNISQLRALLESSLQAYQAYRAG